MAAAFPAADPAARTVGVQTSPNTAYHGAAKTRTPTRNQSFPPTHLQLRLRDENRPRPNRPANPTTRPLAAPPSRSVARATVPPARPARRPPAASSYPTRAPSRRRISRCRMRGTSGAAPAPRSTTAFGMTPATVSNAASPGAGRRRSLSVTASRRARAIMRIRGVRLGR